MFELQSPFIIPDLFTSRVLEAQSFCYAKSALANSCQDLVSQDKSAASLYIVKQSIQSRRIQTFFDPWQPKFSKVLWNIQRRNWRVSAFPPAIPLTLTEVHQRGENIFPSPFLGGWKVWALQVLMLAVAYFPHQWLPTPEMNFKIVHPTDLCNVMELLFGPCSKQCALREVPFVFCRRHVFESVWMCRKVHFRAADIPSPCLCSQQCFLSTSLFSLAEKHILGPLLLRKILFFWTQMHFWKMKSESSFWN